MCQILVWFSHAAHRLAVSADFSILMPDAQPGDQNAKRSRSTSGCSMMFLYMSSLRVAPRYRLIEDRSKHDQRYAEMTFFEPIIAYCPAGDTSQAEELAANFREGPVLLKKTGLWVKLHSLVAFFFGP